MVDQNIALDSDEVAEWIGTISYIDLFVGKLHYKHSILSFVPVFSGHIWETPFLYSSQCLKIGLCGDVFSHCE